MSRIIELSHVIRPGMTTYPGLPTPAIAPHMTREDSRSHYAEGTEFAIDVITLCGNTGTYVDSPFHRYAGATDLAGLYLRRLVDVPTVLVDVTDAAERGIGPEHLAGRGMQGAAVLLHTGWDTRFGTPAYAVGAPFLSRAGAEMLAEAGAAVVGIDSINIDDIESGGERPAHSILLGAGIPVVEHLTHLGDVSDGARFHAAPLAIVGTGTFPVRAYALA
jgi:kynurenine formamidase